MLDLRPTKQTGAKLTDYLPWAALIAPGIVLNKDGAFQRTLQFRGPDLDSATPSELMGVAARINNALRRFGNGWCLHVEARRAPAPGYPDAAWPDAVSWLIDEERRQVFETAGARFESRYFLTLTWLPPAERQGKLESMIFEGGERADGGVDYRVHLENFIERTDQLMALFETMVPMAAWLNDEETLTYLHDCISDRPHRVAVPTTPFHLDALLPDAPLVGGLAPKLGVKHLRIISVRSFVTETEPGLLDALNRLAVSYRWVSRYLPLDREDARKELEKIRKRWFSQRVGLGAMLRAALFKDEPVLHDNAASNLAADADAGLQELGADAIGAGYATLTITIAEEDENAADDAVRQIQQVADGLGFVTQVESVNAVEAWLGSLPGSAYADVRRPILLTPSLAHLLPTSAVWAGPERNLHLNGPPLMLTATDGATPFRLDLHAGDVGHTMIVGPTGAGKSVLLATLAAQWRRYPNAQIYLFDKGRSARATVLGLGGDFFDLGEEGALGLQPLEHIGDESERGPQEKAWALDWIAGLISGAKPKFSAVEETIDDVTLSLDAIIDDLGALASDDKERRHIGGRHARWKFDPGPAAIIEHSTRRPDRGSSTHGAGAIREIEPVDAGQAAGRRTTILRINPRHLRGIGCPSSRHSFDEIGAPVGNEHDVCAKPRCLWLHQNNRTRITFGFRARFRHHPS